MRFDLSKSSGKFQILSLARLLEAGWHVTHDGNQFVLLSDGHGTFIRCRFNQGFDIGHLAEIFLDKCYGSDFGGKIVVDVGMSNGDSAIFFAKNGAAKVVGLEPYRESYDLAVRNIQLSGVSNVVSLDAGLGESVGRSVLNVSSMRPNANSLVNSRGNHSDSQFDYLEEVKTITLEWIMSRFGLERIDFLKMDCEGCEYEIFRQISDSVLRSIQEIVLEFHSGVRTIPSVLSRSGFRVETEGETLGYLRAFREKQP